MLYVSQVRAARGLLGWNQSNLAIESGLAISTIKRMETSGEFLKGNVENVWKVRKALERAGIEFINENGGGPGVRLRDKPKD